jgi:hypothetical protein
MTTPILLRDALPLWNSRGQWGQGQTSRADRYRKEAAEFSELAENAASPFVRGYYQRIAERYLLLAADELRLLEGDGKLVPKQIGSARATDRPHPGDGTSLG